MADNYILTPEGKQQLEEELHYLETEKRAEVGERIKVAREFGDISENSEYDDAKNEQGMLEARIAEITRKRNLLDVVAAVALRLRFQLHGHGPQAYIRLLQPNPKNRSRPYRLNQIPVSRRAFP